MRQFPMRQFIVRHRTTLGLVAVAAVAVASLLLNLALAGRVRDAEQRVEEVAFGAAVVVEQAQQLQAALAGAGPTITQGLDEAIAGLERFRTSRLEFPVAVDEQVPIRTSIPFRRTIEIPIDTELPIEELIETTIRVQGPFGVEIPVSVEVPVSVVVPVNLTIPFTIDETVEVDTTVRIALEVPVALDLAGTELATLADGLLEGLEAVRELIRGLS